MSTFTDLIPTTQNAYNFIAFIITTCFGLIGAVVTSQFSKTRDRKYDSIKLTNEIITRLYLAQATYFLSIYLLVTKEKPASVISLINPLMLVLMLVAFFISARWVSNNNEDLKIKRAIDCNDSNICNSFKCNHLANDCKKDLYWKDIKKVCGGHLKFALGVYVLNLFLSLSPITR